MSEQGQDSFPRVGADQIRSGGLLEPRSENLFDKPPLEQFTGLDKVGSKPTTGERRSNERSEFLQKLIEGARASREQDLLRGIGWLAKEFLARGFEQRKLSLEEWGGVLVKEQSLSPRVAEALRNGLKGISEEQQVATSDATESSASSAPAATSSQETPSSK